MTETLPQTRRLSSVELAHRYLSAKESVIRAGFAAEIDWQEDLLSSEWGETEFMREAAWVILSSGFRESVVRNCFPGVSTAFLEWCSADRILHRREACRASALRAFGHTGKVEAILTVVEQVDSQGVEIIRDGLAGCGPDYLQRFPYVGPVTARHLAKNLGVAVVKPDRHLVRLANEFGQDSVEAMCDDIATVVGDSVAVIDVVFWRYAVLTASEGNEKKAA